jgi:hypothetical protein
MLVSGGWHLEYDPLDPDAEPFLMPSWVGSLEPMPDPYDPPRYETPTDAT